MQPTVCSASARIPMQDFLAKEKSGIVSSVHVATGSGRSFRFQVVQEAAMLA